MTPSTSGSGTGTILTFYSYKGGVGRSMALANVAVLLAGKPRRVLVIDWDLEAPGIEKYFAWRGPHGRTTPLAAVAQTSEAALSASSDPAIAAAPGVVDLMHARAVGRELDWRTCVIETRVGDATLDLITAGRRGPDYSTRLASLDWPNLFANHDLGRYLERLRDEWTAAYDFVLIDSRTGITDIGGICTIHLPDVVVAFFTANQQSLHGVAEAMRAARTAHARLPVDRSQLVVVPVPSRDESHSEHERAAEWRDRFAVALGDLYDEWLPGEIPPAHALRVLRIPYKAYWSFGEPLPVIEDGTTEPGSIGYAYALLASLLDTGLDWGAMSAGRFAVARPLIDSQRQVAVGSSAPGLPAAPGGTATAQDSGRMFSQPNPPPATRTWRPLLAGALIACAAAVATVAVLIYVVGLSRPDRIPVPTYDSGVPDQADAQKAAGLMKAARETQDPLLRALIVREIPWRVFPDAEADVRTLLSGARLPAAVFRGPYTAASFDHSGQSITLSAAKTVEIVDVQGHPQRNAVTTSELDLAFAAGPEGSLFVADKDGVMAGAYAVDYFRRRPEVPVAAASSADGTLTYLLAGVSRSDRIPRRVLSLDAMTSTAQLLASSDEPIVALGVVGKQPIWVTERGAIYTGAAGRARRVVAPPFPDLDRAPLADVGPGWVVVAAPDGYVSPSPAPVPHRMGPPGNGGPVSPPSRAPVRAVPPAIGGVKAWPSRKGVLVRQPVELHAGAPVVAVAAGEKAFAVATSDHVLLGNGDGEPTRIELTDGAPSAMALSDRWLVIGSSTGAVRLISLDPATQAPRDQMGLDPNTGAAIVQVALSSDDKSVLVRNKNGVVVTWNTGVAAITADHPPELQRHLWDISFCLNEAERSELLGEDYEQAGKGVQRCQKRIDRRAATGSMW